MSLEQEIVALLSKEIGPSAPSFFRTCLKNMKKEPAALTKADLDELSKWAFIGIKLTIDEKTAERIKTALLALKK
ncbi:MAG: hypothetical protein NT074_04690 [Methanomicrobiales archaeon]|jgi:hypothetical protein|nr:hypothetical protein [Methanomicrobiales archaeon]